MAFLTMEVLGRSRAYTRDHSRRTFLLQIGPSRRVDRARACPPVLDLVYPSRTRGCVVCSLNGRELRRGKRQAPSISDRASAGPTTRS